MAIQFWLSFNNGAERLRLPVNPETISINTAQRHSDVVVSQLGELSVPGGENLVGVNFESFFPAHYNPTYCEYAGFPSPWDCVERINKWRKSRKPCRITVTGTPINYAVTIREFEYDAERAGNIGDIFYTLELKEFKFVSFRKVEVEPEKAEVEAQPPRPNPAPAPTQYTVVSGDNLSAIAARMNAKGANVTWQQIYEKNKGVIGKNPSLIYPGQKLVI